MEDIPSPSPTLGGEILPETKDILGYKCQKALRVSFGVVNILPGLALRYRDLMDRGNSLDYQG